MKMQRFVILTVKGIRIMINRKPKDIQITIGSKISNRLNFKNSIQGVLDYMTSNRNFITHHEDAVAKTRFEVAERSISEPFTKISHPGNYIMVANLSMSCVYEIIELMQIWIDSKKIGKKNSTK